MRCDPTRLFSLIAVSIGLAGNCATGEEKAFAPAARSVAVYQHPRSDWPEDVLTRLTTQLEGKGFSVRRLSGVDLADASALDPRTLALLVVSDIRTFPAEALGALDRYHKAGGNLMALGGPAFTALYKKYGDAYLTCDAYLAKLSGDPKQARALALPADPTLWHRTTNDPQRGSRLTIEKDGTIHLLIRDLGTGWDEFYTPKLTQPFAKDDQLLSFRAKGDAQTRQMCMEWREQDGSRWVATINLTPEWRTVVLPPQAFRTWENAARHRGGHGDRLRTSRAICVGMGLANTHASVTPAPEHHIWLADFKAVDLPDGVSPDDLCDSPRLKPFIEGVSPHYKLYEVGNLERVRLSAPQIIGETIALPAVGATFSPIVRPQGTGLHKERPWRYVPLLDCLDREGRICGNAAALLLERGTDGKPGCATVTVPVTDPAFFADPRTAAWLAAVAQRLDAGVFLFEGGTPFYTVFENESLPVGALIANRRPTSAEVNVRAAIKDRAGKTVWTTTASVSATADAFTATEAACALGATERAPFTVDVELTENGRVIDRLTHPLRIWKAAAKPEFLRARDGDFWLGGKKWYLHGVNFAPSSGIGIEDGIYYEYYLDAQPYDPEIVGRNLDDIQSVGANAISAFVYYRSLGSRNVLDLLEQCRERGLKVNLALRPGTPMDFRWNEMRELIVTNRLAENDTVIAYDLAWEPFIGRHPVRRTYDREWENWVTAKYGNLAAAEKAWAFAAPTEKGRLANPLDPHLAKDGPWSKMAVDYRRFLNELIGQRYAKARELVRTVDPNHLISFRMRNTGDPTFDPADVQYDFWGLGQAVDLFEPEGYGRGGGWKNTRAGLFTAAYGRAVEPELPIIWAEFGGNRSVDRERMVTDREILKQVGAYYQDFYRMTYEGGFNGSVVWWYPGGYRYNEDSDCGIFNPDRSPRPAAQAVRDWAARMTAPRERPKPVAVIPISVSAHAAGLTGIYQEVENAFWKSYEETGRVPGLKIIEQANTPR